MLEHGTPSNINGYSLIKKIYNLIEKYNEVQVVHYYIETNKCVNMLPNAELYSDVDSVFL